MSRRGRRMPVGLGEKRWWARRARAEADEVLRGEEWGRREAGWSREGAVGGVGEEGPGGLDWGVVLVGGDGDIGGGGAFAHFFIGAGLATGSLEEDVVVAAEVDEVFEEFDEAVGGVLVADGAGEEAIG